MDNLLCVYIYILYYNIYIYYKIYNIFIFTLCDISQLTLTFLRHYKNTRTNKRYTMLTIGSKIMV